MAQFGDILESIGRILRSAAYGIEHEGHTAEDANVWNCKNQDLESAMFAHTQSFCVVAVGQRRYGWELRANFLNRSLNHYSGPTTMTT